MAQLAQLQGLSAKRKRVTEVLYLMVPLVRQLADDNATARWLLSELEVAEDALATENMAASEFVAERKAGRQ